jgi:hypothetical protein
MARERPWSTAACGAGSVWSHGASIIERFNVTNQTGKISNLTYMRPMSVRLLMVAVATGALSAWGVRSLSGQQRTPVMVTRLYTGSDGLTHAEQVPMKLALNPAPAGTERSDRINVNGLQIFRWPPGTVNDWHNASQTPGGHQYVMTLSGRGEIELSDGKKISLEQGRLVLGEDLTGKGHITRAVGSEDWVSVHVSIADQ